MITNFGFTNNMENCIIPTILPMVSNKIELANPFEKNIIICLFGCATNEKYKNQIHNINETWIKKAKERNIITLFFLGEEQTDLVGENYIYIHVIPYKIPHVLLINIIYSGHKYI